MVKCDWKKRVKDNWKVFEDAATYESLRIIFPRMHGWY